MRRATKAVKKLKEIGMASYTSSLGRGNVVSASLPEGQEYLALHACVLRMVTAAPLFDSYGDWHA